MTKASVMHLPPPQVVPASRAPFVGALHEKIVRHLSLAALQIAFPARRLDFERLCVVPVVVVASRFPAINARQSANARNNPVADGPLNDGPAPLLHSIAASAAVKTVQSFRLSVLLDGHATKLASEFVGRHFSRPPSSVSMRSLPG